MSDYFRDDAVCLVEWPERVGDRLPKPDLALSLSYEDEGRDVVAVAHTADGERCLTALAQGEPL
jgi:tRNA threonylcarbamoyladenosine biosynthesis protein TsaE